MESLSFRLVEEDNEAISEVAAIEQGLMSYNDPTLVPRIIANWR